MSLQDIITTLLLCLYSFQVTVCAIEPCKLYENSEVRKRCDKLDIEHARVCYTRRVSRLSYWEATVTCQKGFHEATCLSATCYQGYTYNNVFVWAEASKKCHCEPDKQPEDEGSPEDESSPSIVVYITVPIVTVLLGVISAIFIRVFRKWKLSRSLIPYRLNNRVSIVTNRSYDAVPGVIVGNDDLYVDIDESDIKPSGPENSEYNTLHMDTHRNNNSSQIYNHIPAQPSTSSCKDVEPETDTYSHLKDTNTDKDRSGVNNSDTITDNIYNRLHIDAGC